MDEEIKHIYHHLGDGSKVRFNTITRKIKIRFLCYVCQEFHSKTIIINDKIKVVKYKFDS